MVPWGFGPKVVEVRLPTGAQCVSTSRIPPQDNGAAKRIGRPLPVVREAFPAIVVVFDACGQVAVRAALARAGDGDASADVAAVAEDDFHGLAGHRCLAHPAVSPRRTSSQGAIFAWPRSHVSNTCRNRTERDRSVFHLDPPASQAHALGAGFADRRSVGAKGVGLLGGADVARPAVRIRGSRRRGARSRAFREAASGRTASAHLLVGDGDGRPGPRGNARRDECAGRASPRRRLSDGPRRAGARCCGSRRARSRCGRRRRPVRRT